LGVSFESNLLFCAGTDQPGPNHAKLRLVLPILKYDGASYFELPTNRAQTHTITADV
jgi:hypothetical protein